MRGLPDDEQLLSLQQWGGSIDAAAGGFRTVISIKLPLRYAQPWVVTCSPLRRIIDGELWPNFPPQPARGLYVWPPIGSIIDASQLLTTHRMRIRWGHQDPRVRLMASQEAIATYPGHGGSFTVFGSYLEVAVQLDVLNSTGHPPELDVVALPRATLHASPGLQPPQAHASLPPPYFLEQLLMPASAFIGRTIPAYATGMMVTTCSAATNNTQVALQFMDQGVSSGVQAPIAFWPALIGSGRDLLETPVKVPIPAGAVECRMGNPIATDQRLNVMWLLSL